MLRILLSFLAGILVLAVAAVLVATLARIPVDITSYKGPFESAASEALGRRVAIDGKIVVTTSLWPYFEIGALRVSSPPGFDADDLARMKRARVAIGVLPLLQRKLHVRALAVEGLALNLVRTEDGEVNWSTPRPAKSGSSDPATGRKPAEKPGKLVVDGLRLRDISVHFDDRASGDMQDFVLFEARGAAPADKPMTLVMEGVFRDYPYTVSVEATSLAEFLAMTHSRIDMQVDIVGTRLQFGGFTDRLGNNLKTELDVDIEGAQLANLNGLLGLDLPPLENYRLRANLLARPGQLELTGLDVRVRQSVFTGRASVDSTVEPPSVSAELISETIQLQDFDTGDWSPGKTESDSDPAAEPESGRKKAAKLLSAETLGRLNANLSFRVVEVLSGRDRFGNGELVMTLQDGRLAVAPLKLAAGEQSVLLEASLRPGAQVADASLRVLVENVDLGALMRLSRPDSEVGGVLNMDVDVETTAGQFHNLLARADGYFDISGVPEKLESGVVDLWAVNLLSSVVTSAVRGDEASQVNCVLGRWSLQNGRMKARQLAVDTSRIRICGEGEVDFSDRTLDLTITPKAKRPEFFSLATPLRVRGYFDDFGIGMKGGPVAIGTTALGFAVSPITTPLKRLLREDLPADGADICSLPIGPQEDELEELPGC